MSDLARPRVRLGFAVGDGRIEGSDHGGRTGRDEELAGGPQTLEARLFALRRALAKTVETGVEDQFRRAVEINDVAAGTDGGFHFHRCPKITENE